MKQTTDELFVLNQLIKSQKISHAFLIEVDEDYTTSLAKKIVKQLLKSKTQKEIFYKICTLIDCDNFPELKIVKPEGKFIKKEQVTKVMYELKNKPIYTNTNFYIIEFAENLNTSSANTILKFLEEPEEGIIAILITKNIYNVLPTISSRCQILNFNKYQKKNFDDNFFVFALDFILKYKEYKKHSIAYFSELYSLKQEDLIEVLNLCIIIYSDILKFIKTNEKSDYIKNNIDLEGNLNKFESLEIINIENKIIEILNMIKYNVNTRIALDKLIVGE